MHRVRSGVSPAVTRVRLTRKVVEPIGLMAAEGPEYFSIRLEQYALLCARHDVIQRRERLLDSVVSPHLLHGVGPQPCARRPLVHGMHGRRRSECGCWVWAIHSASDIMG